MIGSLLFQCLLERAPDDSASRIAIALRVQYRFDVGPESKTIEDDTASLRHVLLSCLDGVVEFGQRRLDQERIVQWKADPDAGLRGKAAGKPQHFGAIGLKREIAQHARVGVGADTDAPAEDRTQLSFQQCLRFHGVRPTPEDRERRSMVALQVTSLPDSEASEAG